MTNIFTSPPEDTCVKVVNLKVLIVNNRAKAHVGAGIIGTPLYGEGAAHNSKKGKNDRHI